MEDRAGGGNAGCRVAAVSESSPSSNGDEGRGGGWMGGRRRGRLGSEGAVLGESNFRLACTRGEAGGDGGRLGGRGVAMSPKICEGCQQRGRHLVCAAHLEILQ
jgi:hypothetical protein